MFYIICLWASFSLFFAGAAIVIDAICVRVK